jgi:hypothetical protein
MSAMLVIAVGGVDFILGRETGHFRPRSCGAFV